MVFIVLNTLIHPYLWLYTRWGNTLESEQHSISEVVYTIPYLKNMLNCFTYAVTSELQETRERSPTPFSKCRVDKSGPHQKGGLGDQHKYSFIHPIFLHIFHLHVYHPVYQFTDSPDMYRVSSGRWVPGSMTPDSAKIFSHDRYCIPDIWALKWSELGLKAQNLKNSCILVDYDHKLCNNIKQSHITIK